MVSASFLIIVTLIMSAVDSLAIGLSFEYYAVSCPIAELVVKNTVITALHRDPTLAAGLLRMHFHDCFVEGCDGSVLIDSTKDNMAEKNSPANLSLRGFEIVDIAKDLLEKQCPGVVSCADILAMAARDAVFFAGGPVYDIPKGRKDGRRSRVEDTIQLPPPTFNATELISTFAKRGFTSQEMVALSGAHTLGAARCSSFKMRLSDDRNLDMLFAGELRKTCDAGDNAEQQLDSTRNIFDNDYYNMLRMNSGVLLSDQTLFSSPITRGIVDAYAANEAAFFFNFQRAMIKLGVLDVKVESQGEVRSNCRCIN